MAVMMESATFMGKNFLDNQNSIVNTADLTLKQMFDISAKLVAEQDEISNLETILVGKNIHDTRKFHRKNSIYVDVQRHFLWNERQ